MGLRTQLRLVSAAGTCLALCACGASGTGPAADGPASAGTSSAANAALTGHFCSDATHLVRNLPSAPASKHTSEADERAELSKVLKTAVTDFKGLQAEGPASLHGSLKKIVRVYKKDERTLQRSGSLTTVSDAMVHSDAVGAAAFQRVVKYISTSCK